MIDLIVNDLSFEHPRSLRPPAAQDTHTARHWMTDFVSCIRIASQKGWVKGIRTKESFVSVELSPGYSLYQWRNDKAVDRDERLYFKRIITYSPYLVGAHKEVQEQTVVSEVYVGDRPARGLQAALLMHGIALSWGSAEVWVSARLAAILSELRSGGEIVNSTIEIPNVSMDKHWGQHKDLITFAQLSGIADGPSLLKRIEDSFEHIELCGDAPRQIRDLTGGETHFAWVVQSIWSANDRCAEWKSGEFPHALLPGPATGESSTVHNNPDLRQLRVFSTQSGERVMFEHHMKNASENQRIHYLADKGRRKVLIAYVGAHLPTARF